MTLNGVVFTKFTGANNWRRAGKGLALYVNGQRVGGINRDGVLYRSRRLESGKDRGKWWHSYGTPEGIPAYESVAQRESEVRRAMDEAGMRPAIAPRA